MNPTMVAFGGGVNSTALLVGLADRGQRPDAILFADTGAEKPETYAHVATMSAWCLAQGFPEIVTVRNEQTGPLERHCLAKGMLPSLAYGAHKRGCSEKAKQRPQHQWARRWPAALECRAAGGKVRKLIGYSAQERYRARIEEDRFYEYDYPLIQWGWDQEACRDAILRAGLAVPPKSSCFFCPAMKKREILQLGREHPDLLDRAIVLERAARPGLQGGSIKGLGGYFAWEDWYRRVSEPLPLFEDDLVDANPFGCMCVTPTEDEP